MKVTTSLPAIQTLLQGWQQAVTRQDVDAIMSHYSDDLTAYDAILQLQFCGKPAYRAHYAQCFQMCPPGRMQWEMRDVQIEAGNDLAFCFALILCGMMDDSGTLHGGWLRWTGCLRRVDQRWLFVHEHFSAPFDPASGKVLELQP